MAESLTVSIYSPEKKLLEEAAVSINLPGREGAFTVLKGHTPLVCELEAGVVTVQTDKATEYYVVDSGFAEIFNNKVIVLVEGALDPRNIKVAEEKARLAETLNTSALDNAANEKKLHDVSLIRARIRAAEMLGSASSSAH